MALNFQLGMPSATLRVANQKELISIVFGERSLRSKEEGIPKRSLGTRKSAFGVALFDFVSPLHQSDHSPDPLY